MQNRGALWVFTILLALACLWQLSFSVFTNRFESKAHAYAKAVVADSIAKVPALARLDQDSLVLLVENKYTREHANDEIYPVLGYTYEECKGREINQGLDLKGGMSVTLEVSIPELVDNLAGKTENAAFRTAIANAREAQKRRQDDFITLFAEEYTKADPNGKLAAIFSTQENSTMFPRESTNDEVIAILRQQAKDALDNTEKILRNRIDKFGVSQPSIQKQTLSGRIQIELPGVKDKDRVRKMIVSTANLEFYETYDRQEVFPKLVAGEQALSARLYPDLAHRDSLRVDSMKTVQALSDTLKKQIRENLAIDSLQRLAMIDSISAADSIATVNAIDTVAERARFAQRRPLFGLNKFIVNDGPAQGQKHVDFLGQCQVSDTAEFSAVLREIKLESPDPSMGIRLLWSNRSERTELRDPQGNTFEADVLVLRAIKVPRNGKARLDGNAIVDAQQDFDEKNEPEVVMQMDADGGNIWKLMTGENVGKTIAIVLDNYIVSAPNVMGEIPGGRSTISMGSGDLNKSLQEAQDLANILKAGALPASPRIIDETVVGATLGEENVNDGLISFGVAMLLVMIFMIIYYNGGGWVANVALLANVFVLLGTLASLQASLTLPGIAGIVLTVGMAVDANVLINERIREELRHGKALKSAIDLGYKHAMSAIIDANVTHLASAVILIFFGTGPIKSFGVTLGLGILTSLFTAIFISRLVITRRLEKGKTISFWHSWNKNVFANAKYDFMSKRKYFYFVSAAVIILGFVSIFTRGFQYGVDFSGGRQYVVKFTQPADVEQVKKTLGAVYAENGVEATPGVKTYGGSSQLMITTNYLVNESSLQTDSIVESKLHAGLGDIGGGHKVVAQRKVDPTISDDIRAGAWWAVGAALAFMFVYIAIRFRTWQFGVGALLSLTHDALVVVGLYSLLWGIMPFPLEVDENFIAAILTVIGYSINDTVVVFDRIREYLQDHKREPWEVVFNKAINSTLGRTINTALTVLLVLLVIFVLGGITIQGFVFAMLVGIAVGTYSSIFIASAVVVDLHKDKVPEAAPAKAVLA